VAHFLWTAVYITLHYIYITSVTTECVIVMCRCWQQFQWWLWLRWVKPYFWQTVHRSVLLLHCTVSSRFSAVQCL